jgi:hypothetical protein
MNTITRKAAAGGYVFQVIAGADMASDLSEDRARNYCERLGGRFPAAYANIAARPATSVEHINVDA